MMFVELHKDMIQDFKNTFYMIIAIKIPNKL